ncbi:uncharacterized protein [Palaemon carinicauda]|uniref:uncharacterized protein n=1 Tax=Palaemon carinicauda TaxID=392227 RepID=UPI0035B59821
MSQVIKKTIDTAFRHSRIFSGINEKKAIVRRCITTIQNPLLGTHNPSADIRSECNEDLKWMFPASKEIEELCFAHKHRSSFTCGVYSFNAKLPLKHEEVEKALIILQRKIPSFCCCMKKRDDQFWICDTNPRIDFEILEGVSSSDVTNGFCNDAMGYEEGPLWKTRLLRVPDNSPCILPEIKEAFPYQYDLIVSYHHAFFDGYTGVIFANTLVQVLNDVIAGRPVDNQPSAVYASYADIQELHTKIRRQLEDDPDKLRELKEEILACDNTPILFKAYPPPGGEDHSVGIIRNIDNQTLQKFHAYCKNAGVTFNSGFEALVNTALVEMVRDAGVDDESHQISINLSMDLRRYKRRYELPIVGLHRRQYTHRVSTSSNVRNHFWKYTQKLHNKLNKEITSGEVLEQYVVRQMTMPQIQYDEYYKGNPPMVRDYCLANVGDITKVLPGVGDHLQLTSVYTKTGLIKAPYLMMHHTFTFRGHSPYTLSYNRKCMSDDTAGQLMDRVMNLLQHFPQ